ncbi:MAG: enoyl-CoA hydratase-related protein [Ardenticatenaceae bacterium]|nr:enoyl-CoA hydratase-related protein [Ardenticatenaceae bacterium]
MPFRTTRRPGWSTYESTIDRVVGRLAAVQKPTIALIDGAAVGGGLILALNCDLRVATPESKLSVPCVKLGNCLSMCNYARLIELVGPARTLELMHTGRLVPAAEAYTCGLVNSTRGRANALRVALTGRLGPEGMTSRELYEVLDLCLECKGCKRECPSLVDMARLKYEFLAHYQARHGVPLRSRLFAHVATLNRLAGLAPGLANWGFTNPLLLAACRLALPGQPTPTATPVPLVLPARAAPPLIVSPAPTATPGGDAVSFRREMLPIFQARCVACHGGISGLYLTSYDYVLAGGINGPGVIPGDPGNSNIVTALESGYMPAGAPVLPPEEIELIRAWVAAGAPNN